MGGTCSPPYHGLASAFAGRVPMKENVYKIIQLTGVSGKSIEDAVATAVKRASRTLKNLRWFEIVETRGNIEKDRVRHWQVTIKVGFAVDE